MQFRVPQFIDVEDKLFGPLTFKQFAYLAGGVGMGFVLYKLLPLFVAIVLIIPIATLSLLLAFYKVNNKPFIYYLQAGINYLTKSRLYVWQQRIKQKEEKSVEESITPVSILPRVSGNRISDISWSLDVLDKK
jgi:hypothetical protein